MKRQTSRREFLKETALAGIGAGIGYWTSTSLRAEEKSPNDKVDIGVIGAGGKGSSDTDAVRSQNVVALCDVDERGDRKDVAENRQKTPKAKFYTDYREMLEKEKLDAVIVATPDHTHAPASLMAMRLGKHVYCQKPLTHLVQEARLMREYAKKYNVATQMGNQGSAESGLRRAVEVIQAGALGDVHEIYVWTNRPIWPQGFDKPKPEEPVPSTLKWDLWLGVAPQRAFNHEYCPFAWRGWWDFGTGALGDMACHTANLPFRGCELEYPIAIEAKCDKLYAESPPKWSIIQFDFPARASKANPGKTLPPVKFVWSDGLNGEGRANLPKSVLEGLDLANVKSSRKKKKAVVLKTGDIPIAGCLVVGEKGKLFSPDDYGAEFKIFSENEIDTSEGKIPQRIPRSPGHYQEWIRAIKGGPAPYSNFDIAAFLTEIILLGNLALRVPGKKVEWDGPNMKSPNCPEVEKYVKMNYRPGYSSI